jgi:predicted anti-sigma-YlaC factor YlaD
MITCQEITENASAYLDSPNNVNRPLALRFHLLMCHRCRRFFKQFKIAVDVSRKLNIDSDTVNNEPTDAEIEKLLRKLQARDTVPPVNGAND